MALTPAEKQAAYRERQRIKLQQEMEALRQQADSPAQSGPNLGPKTPLTPEEADHLRPYLMEFRKRQAAAAASKRETEEMMENLKRNRPEDHAKMEADMKRQQEREALKEKSRPVAGVTYWVRGTNTETLAGLVMPTTIVKGRADFGTYTEALKFAKGVWMTKSDRTLYASKQDALAALFDSPRWNPLTAIPEKDLRKLWSYHHPDRFNADGDQTIYQAAGEELDRRRASNNS